MRDTVAQALNNIDMTYEELIDVANELISDIIGDVDNLVHEAYDNVTNLTNDAIRDLLLKLSLRSYSFSEIKEKAIFKATLAETLRKEAYSKNYHAAVGTGGQRDSTATMNTSAEILAEEIYTLVASAFKTRLDEIHRVVDTLKSVMMSRLSEAKLTVVEG